MSKPELKTIYNAQYRAASAIVADVEDDGWYSSSYSDPTIKIARMRQKLEEARQDHYNPDKVIENWKEYRIAKKQYTEWEPV